MRQYARVAIFTIQNEFRYEIVRKIFEGGMGIVYEAEQLGAREFVKHIAIKVIRQNYADQKQFIENFIGEAKLVADLIHTNIVQTYHLGEADGAIRFVKNLDTALQRKVFRLACLYCRRVLSGDQEGRCCCRGDACYAHATSINNFQEPGTTVHRWPAVR